MTFTLRLRLEVDVLKSYQESEDGARARGAEVHVTWAGAGF